MATPALKRLLLPAAVVALSAAMAGCSVAEQDANLVNGKSKFVAKCGSCHVLARANATGVTGPNLDEAFRTARAQGFGQSTFEGVVLQQIQEPSRRKQQDPQTLKDGAEMPADLVEGQDARDVAAYVASAVAQAGEDEGQLAQIGPKKSTESAKAKSGELEIPADPSGALLFAFGAAEAPAGALKLMSPNESSVPHNIAVEGQGVDEQGEVVQGGAVSEIAVDLKPGEYTFYCSVPGHREGGMEGKLTVQ
jgi:mono/diheme cytochrome c family protein